MGSGPRMLVWSIEETSGFDTAWASIEGSRLRADGHAAGLLPTPYWVSYQLQTGDAFVMDRLVAEARWDGGSATLDLRREDDRWTVDGTPRSDLDEALDCDLAACPLTNTMPIVRHRLHRQLGDVDFLMAFIEVPSLRVVPSRQHYTHLRTQDDGGVVRFSSGSFQSELIIDGDGFVIDYPQLGRRLEPQMPSPAIRAAGPGSARPE